MSYDRDLANQLREALAREPGVTEKAMFGGLAFLVDGKMAVTASKAGGLLARVDPADAADLLGDHVATMVMAGKPRTGWLHVDAEAVAEQDALDRWVRRSVTYTRTLPG